MKKEYITPEMIVRHVFIEGIMQQLSTQIGDDPTPGIGWGQQESKDGDDLWPDNGNDLWED